MKLANAWKTWSLALVVIALATDLLLPPRGRRPRAAEACLPRVNFFGLGGRRESAEKPFDREAEEQSHWMTADWIEKHKHPLELHEVTTRDGYRLQLHRLPRPGHRPVLLVHGLLTSSLAWVLLGPGQSLAFLLYAKEFDVWLANTRGSRHGRNHTTLSPDDEAAFWSFSFHEVGAFDLPAIVDRVRDESSFHQLFVVTHSEAFNSFLVLLALHPDYNERILLIQALAPLAELHDQTRLSTAQIKRIAKFLKAREKSQNYELFKAGELRERCLKQNSEERSECLQQLEVVVGSALHSRSIDPLLFGGLLQGGSLKAVGHLLQLWRSGDFVAFDYGVEGNRAAYNSVEPLAYDLSQLTVPLLLHFGETDAVATPAGVHHVYAHMLPCCVLGVHRVPAPSFNHLDFVAAPELRRLVNDRLVEMIERFLAGTLQYVIE